MGEKTRAYVVEHLMHPEARGNYQAPSSCVTVSARALADDHDEPYVGLRMNLRLKGPSIDHVFIVRDTESAEELGRLLAKCGRQHAFAMAVDSDYVLLAGERSDENAFFDEMRLYSW